MNIKAVLVRINQILALPVFFWVLVGLFIFEALWVALTSRYPMAFDEDFHLGIIKLYAQHPSPLWLGQPPDADSFGSIATDPSYFYHFLMSFPYRFIQLFTNDVTIQVIWLRIINVALFASSLPLWRALLRRAGGSDAMINVSMAIFVLIPITPVLAGQINYDNLVMPLTVLALLLTSQVIRMLRTAKQFPLVHIINLLTISLFASIVKYAFLPIFLAIVIYILVVIFQKYRSFSKLFKGLRRDVPQISKPLLGITIVAFVIFLGLFIQRDIVNVVRFHTPVPSCEKVLSISECSSYAPWNRDYILKTTKTQSLHNPIAFSYEWVYGMWLRSLFAVAGPSADFETRGPMLLPALTIVVVGGLGFIIVLRYGFGILKRSPETFRMMLIAVAVYCLVLWLDEFESYVRTGKPVAINGRYLLPVLLPLIMWVGMSYSRWLRRWPRARTILAVISIVCFAWGGGVLTYVLRSNDYWYWPNTTVVRINSDIRNAVGPLVPGYNNPTQFLR
jgi:hypothetical protein